MKKTLSNTIGERINKFDDMEDNSVAMFNTLFPECPLDFDSGMDVLIGQVLPNNRRAILVGGDNLIEHKMFSDKLYGIDKQEYNEEELELDEMHGHPV